jgi:hypothetical protein
MITAADEVGGMSKKVLLQELHGGTRENKEKLQ